MDKASNGTPMNVLTEADWETPYGLGKFDTVAAEKVWHWTLSSGQTEDCGNSTDWYWWSAKFDFDGDDPAHGFGIIVTEMSGGSVSATRYESAVERDAAWLNLMEQYLDAAHKTCEDGRDCDGCPECENGI